VDFIEVLIILVFIVVPLLEGVLKQRRGKQVPREQPAPRPREPVGAGAGAGTAREAGSGGPSDAGPAADMIPPDLWEVLTGERRTQQEPPPAPWEEEWADEAALEDVATTEVEGDVIAESSPWESGSWDVSGSETALEEPVSLEYVGPEAISMEGPPPPPEIRHRLYHEKYDAPQVSAEPRDNPLVRQLRSGLQGDGLRRSILIAEILGPPKGIA
jgi:hypothetical protein